MKSNHDAQKNINFVECEASEIPNLPEKQKTAIILLKIEQKTQAETAEIMDTTVKAIESLFQRGKKNLQKILTANEGK